MSSKLLSGSFWLSFGSLFSRVMGILYLIPWLYMIGTVDNQTTAQALFNTAYTPYALFISLGTAGFPSAVARQVSYFNSVQDYRSAKKVAHIGFYIMLLSGILCGFLLYMLAPILAQNSPVEAPHQSIIAIKCLVPAIIILPSMSILRGWFQGNQDFKPFGVSQLYEQFVRIITILIGTYAIIYIFKSDYLNAVYLSVFAAFVGALASYIYLINALKKMPSMGLEKIATEKSTLHNTTLQLVLKTAYQSIPFVIVGSGITFSQLIDQLFFKQILQGSLHYTSEKIQYIYTVFSANPTKITTALISIAIAIGETTLPVLAGIFAKNTSSVRDIGTVITDNIHMLLYFMLPMIGLLIALSNQVYGLFFNFDELGGAYLRDNLIQSLFLGLAIDLLTILQAVRQSKKAVAYLSIGLLIKIVLQFPLVFFFQAGGAIFATTIAFFAVIALTLKKLSNLYEISIASQRRVVLVNILFSLILFVSMYLLKQTEIMSLFNTKLTALVFLTIFSIASLFLYCQLSNRSGLSHQLFNKKIGYCYFRYKHFK